MSLPSRERGLKSEYTEAVWEKPVVAPFAGAWIEIILARISSTMPCRSLRGSVD